MSNNHGNCPHCDYDLNGDKIWDHFYNQFQVDGYWLDEAGNYIRPNRILTPEQAEIAADKTAASYGATRTEGRFGKVIGIYDMEKDRTVAWQCPRCDGRWDRKGNKLV